MSEVFTALAVPVDGFITGRDPGPGHGLGDGGLPDHSGLELVEVVPAPGVTHLRYRIEGKHA